MSHERRAYYIVPLLFAAASHALRNVDRCELLIWTRGALVAGNPARLLAEAQDQSTLLAYLTEHEADESEGDQTTPPSLRRYQCTAPVNSAQLLDLLSLFDLQPEGFGGSDGFGRAPSQVNRAPLAARSVMLLTTLSECAAARAAGMRTVALPDSVTGQVIAELEGVADACIDSLEDLWLDELSTPGVLAIAR
mmetsp:Transcript_3949/g.6592  ORF Transcript_3949/g.6592 Transcript_3949/m.6592 type:complete len:193 (-) Transcript_3949:511-1089(-)